MRTTGKYTPKRKALPETVCSGKAEKMHARKNRLALSHGFDYNRPKRPLKGKGDITTMDLKQVRNTVLLVLAALIWGCAFVAQSVGAEYVGAFTFLASRSWLGGVVLLPLIAVLDAGAEKRGAATGRPHSAAERKTLLLGGVCCGLFLFLASAAQQFGIAYTTTAKAGFITTMYVLIVPLLSLFLGRRVGAKIWVCVAVGVFGLYLLCMKGGFSLGRGDALVLLCALLFSCHILTVGHFSPKVDGVRLSCIQFFVTAILSTICMFLFEKPSWEAIRSAALPILYAGVLSSGAGYTLQIVGQKGLDPTVASLAMSLESVFSALAGWLILHQTMTSREICGGALMFAAIVLAQLPERERSTVTAGQDSAER
jgi:drug/metabolite transporter (DMT)-like permease